MVFASGSSRSEENSTLPGTSIVLARALQRVFYDPAETKDRIRNGMRSVLREYDAVIVEATRLGVAREVRHSASLDLVLVACHAAMLTKPRDKSWEAEWRSIALPSELVVPSVETDDTGRNFLPLRFRAQGKRLTLDELLVFSRDLPGATRRINDILGHAGYAGPEIPTVVASAHT